MKKLYQFHWDCGRMGFIDGLFIEESEKVEQLISSGFEVYFGEVLGKHSEIYGIIEESDIKEVTSDKKVIEVFEKNEISSGYNPFNYIDEDEYQEYLDEQE